MRIGRRNQSTRRKPAPVPACPPQIPHDLTWAQTRATTVGNRRLAAWAMARPPVFSSVVRYYFRKYVSATSIRHGSVKAAWKWHHFYQSSLHSKDGKRTYRGHFTKRDLKDPTCPDVWQNFRKECLPLDFQRTTRGAASIVSCCHVFSFTSNATVQSPFLRVILAVWWYHAAVTHTKCCLKH
jgi:hypothetical protein